RRGRHFLRRRRGGLCRRAWRTLKQQAIQQHRYNPLHELNNRSSSMIGIEDLKRHARRGILAGAAAMALATAGAAANAPEKVTFAYATNTSLSNAPTLMAIGMGYFKEAGLDVQATFFQGAAVMLPQVTQKHITFGWITPDPLVISRQPGRDALPVKMFYNGIYLSPFEVVVTKNSPARSLADLKGKKIGVGAMSWGNLAVTKAMMKKLGLELQ